MSLNKIEYKNLVWINIEGFNEETARFLQKEFKFHILDLKDCLGESQSPKIDIYKYYIFIIFHFPEFRRKERKISSKELAVFLGPNYLVTIQKEKIRALNNYFQRAKEDRKFRTNLMNLGSTFLLYKILNYLFRRMRFTIEFLGKELSEIEDRIFQEKGGEDILYELAILRRNILTLKKIIDPQRFTINTLVNVKMPFIPQEMSFYFDDIHDLIEKTSFSLENYKEYSESLFVTNESMISNRINEIMKILTIISVILLPLNLIASIYGMNIVGLPWASHPNVLWIILGIMGIFILLIFLFFKRKRWL